MPAQEAVATGVRDQIKENPALFKVAIEHYEATVYGEISVDDVDYADMFLQTYGTVRDPTVAGLIIATFHADLLAGRAAFVRIEVGETPHRDKEIEANRAALADLPGPFTATLNGVRGAPQDGVLSWDLRAPDAPKHPGWRWPDPDGYSPGEDSTAIVPLEVGYTDPETLYFHYKRSMGFARWPYDSTDIIAFRRRPPENYPAASA